MRSPVSSSVPSVISVANPSSPHQKSFQNYSRPQPRSTSQTHNATETLHRFATLYYFATLQKRWARLGCSCSLQPRLALGRGENTQLSSSVGGGQISLTSVLIGGFDH